MNDNDLYQLVKWLDARMDDNNDVSGDNEDHLYTQGALNAYTAVKDKIEELIGSEL